MTKPKFVNGPLPLLYSCRVRLDDAQRDQLRTAHAAMRGQYVKESAPVMAGSTISVETTAEAPISRYQQFGFSPLVVTDLIGTRETIALPVILKLQELFGIELISRKTLESAFSSYLDYLEV